MALVSGGFGVHVVSHLSRASELHPVQRIPLSGEHAPTRHIAAITRAGAKDRRATRYALDALKQGAANRHRTWLTWQTVHRNMNHSHNEHKTFRMERCFFQTSTKTPS